MHRKAGGMQEGKEQNRSGGEWEENRTKTKGEWEENWSRTGGEQ